MMGDYECDCGDHSDQWCNYEVLLNAIDDAVSLAGVVDMPDVVSQLRQTRVLAGQHWRTRTSESEYSEEALDRQARWLARLRDEMMMREAEASAAISQYFERGNDDD